MAKVSNELCFVIPKTRIRNEPVKFLTSNILKRVLSVFARGQKFNYFFPFQYNQSEIEIQNMATSLFFFYLLPTPIVSFLDRHKAS